MKYFNPSYWFKLWILSAPLFNCENQGIYAKSIDNKKIKDWISKDITSLESINEQSNLTNWNTNYQSYSLNKTNQNIDPFYQSYLDSFSNQQLETSTEYHHEKSKNRHKREGKKENNFFHIYNTARSEYLYSPSDINSYDIDRRRVFTWKNKETLGEEGIWQLQAVGSNNEYNIYNVYRKEYLYAADYAPYDNDRRRVFTWREKNENVNNDIWRININSNSDSYIYNIGQSEYLYSPNDHFAYDNNRRRVFTWRKKMTL